MMLGHDYKYEWITRPKCAYCGYEIKEPSPQINVILGHTKKVYGDDQPSLCVQNKVPFYSAKQVLLKTRNFCIGERSQLLPRHPKWFRRKQHELFWNNIRYFVKNDLPYDLFLPIRHDEIAEIQKELSERPLLQVNIK